MDKSLDEKFMNIALSEARLALADGELPVGSVVVRDGVVLSRRHKFRGCNSRFDHAECLVIRDICNENYKDLSDVCVYTNLEPCTMCFATMLNVRVGRIVYALEDPFDGFAGIFDPKNATIRHRYQYPEIRGGVLRDASKRIFKRFFETTDNTFWRAAKSNPLVRVALA